MKLFYELDPSVIGITTNNSKVGPHEYKKLCTAKDTVIQSRCIITECCITGWKKFSTSSIFDKGIISRIYKELKN